jgi:hypothetical protein
MVRVVLAFLVTWLAAPALLSLSGDVGTEGLIYLLLSSGAGVILLGVPLFVAFVRRGWLSVGAFLAGGAGAGLVWGMLSAVFGGLAPTAGNIVAWLQLAVLLSLLHAGLLWVLAVPANAALARVGRASRRAGD